MMIERDSGTGSSPAAPRSALRARRPVGGRAALLLSCLAVSAGLASGCKKSSSNAGPKGPPVTLAPPAEPKHSLLKNASFKEGSSLPWLTSFSAPAAGKTDVKDGALCLTMDDKGKNAWDAQLLQRPVVIQQGHSYAVDFRAWASAPTTIRPKVGMAGPPYSEYWAARLDVGPQPQRFQGTFTMGGADDKTAEFTFHLAGALAKSVPVTICIDDLYLTDPQFDAPPPDDDQPPPKVAVNQTGYLPKLGKIAVLDSAATEPQKWELLDGQGVVVADGTTTVFGADPNSGNSVHRIDFSSYKKPGKGYVLRVGEDKSHPFDIDAGIYSKLKYDALSYFYHNRSGIEIKMPFAGGEQWTRPAGHLPDKAPCGRDIGCNYTLDVTGGWYDAGDHGKYVVNGGFSAWTLLNQWERTKHLGKAIKDL
jgi:endoglucanase